MNNKRMILAIETSCDETAGAIINEDLEVVTSIVSTQIDIHASYGGVVPSIASREHVNAINGVIKETMTTANVKPEDLTAIAVTIGPGLPGSLAIGVSAAKALSYAWNKPFLAINHLEGHICSAELNGEQIEFPALYLLVSGGHCMIVFCEKPGEYKLLGSTLDDSLGEAYDKVAKELGYEYPGGPKIDKLSLEGKDIYKFPRPLQNKGYEFSFSGLKSAVRREIEKGNYKDEDIATSFVVASMDVIITKLKKAVNEYSPKSIVVVGGVSKSPILRDKLNQDLFNNIKVVFPSLKYSTDNAAMIGAAAWHQYKKYGASDISLPIMPDLSLNSVEE